MAAEGGDRGRPAVDRQDRLKRMRADSRPLLGPMASGLLARHGRWVPLMTGDGHLLAVRHGDDRIVYLGQFDRDAAVAAYYAWRDNPHHHNP